MHATGYITGVEDGQWFDLRVPFSETYLIDKRQITEAEVRLDDGRRRSEKQSRAIHKINNEIAKCYGWEPDELKAYFKSEFAFQSEIEPFSMHDVDMTTARLFMRYLIHFCIFHGTTFTKFNIFDFIKDEPEEIWHWVYYHILYKKCAITGQENADLHHCTGSRVGMGRNRKQIVHVGLKCLPLNRILHNECHNDEAAFMNKYHIEGIELDEHLCESLGLNYEAS